MRTGFSKNRLISLADLFFAPLTYISALLLLKIRHVGVQRMYWSKKILMSVGVFPITDHYYEPMFNSRHLTKRLTENRCLPGIDLNVDEQLAILSRFDFSDELGVFPLEKNGELQFHYHNTGVGPGDAEYLYNMIRLFKPRKILEIGSGNSTLMALNAIKQNKEDDPDYVCQITCVEPYENHWLEKLDVKVLREKVENLDKELFRGLGANDILFIDSTHIIRPQGDVLFEYQEILPILRPGVIIHIHDIFTPKNYPEDWVSRRVIFWNEQYLLEAFLTFNDKYKIIGALNYLKHNYFKELSDKCPVLKNEPDREPRSFWMVRVA